MANENVIDRKKVRITLRDGEEYTIQPLTLNELIEVWPLIAKLENQQDKVSIELLNDMRDLVHVALKGKVEKEKVGDLVDLVDIQKIIAAIVGQNPDLTPIAKS